MDVSEAKISTSNAKANSDCTVIAVKTALTGWCRLSLDRHAGMRLSDDIRSKTRDRAIVPVRMTVGDATNAPALIAIRTTASFETESSGSVALTCVYGTAPHRVNATMVKTTLTFNRLPMSAEWHRSHTRHRTLIQ